MPTVLYVVPGTFKLSHLRNCNWTGGSQLYKIFMFSNTIDALTLHCKNFDLKTSVCLFSLDECAGNASLILYVRSGVPR